MQDQSDFRGAEVNNSDLSRKKWRPMFALPHAPDTAKLTFPHAPITATLSFSHAPVVPPFPHAPITATLAFTHAPVAPDVCLHGLLQFSIVNPSIFWKCFMLFVTSVRL